VSNEFTQELQEIAERLQVATDRGNDPEVAEPLRQMEQAAIVIGAAWSGSPLGYHACVYYEAFATPPAGAHWSSEWGNYQAMSGGSTGNWREYTREDVVAEIRGRAGRPDLAAAETASADGRAVFDTAKGDVLSILTAFLGERSDELLTNLKERTEKLVVRTTRQYAQATLPGGQYMSRDNLAISQGLQVAPHLYVQAEVLGVQAPFRACGQLADIARRTAAHIARLPVAPRPAVAVQGGAVFIGHGRSPMWRELKDFIQDRLALPWEEFNRVPVAGMTNIARLTDMLDASGVAFLLLTAEDEQADGKVAARQNVVHEAGLFQGHLGFSRAIVVLEEGCEEFSNIHGLGEIRFPPGNISAAFEEVRRVLEREGFIDGAEATTGPADPGQRTKRCSGTT
jgi:predicted nucleotide-binding protein